MPANTVYITMLNDIKYSWACNVTDRF